LPAGYRVTQESVSLGRDPALLGTVGDELFAWKIHRGAGLSCAAGGRADTLGVDVVLAVPLLGVHLFAACRVVAVIREESRIGFAYGTLPMHPESGEESFVVELVDGVVRFSVTAFSRPTGRIRRLGRPIQDRVQDQFTERYLRAAEGLARG
jgi:uncharacterized protein (UPF0548 family)